MLIGPSDAYGDMSLEDVDEFEGLQPDDEREIAPGGQFQRDEFRNFEEDFEYDLDNDSEYQESEYDLDGVGEECDEFMWVDGREQ